MAQIKYKPNDWSNAMDTIDTIKRWSQVTYSELNEDGKKNTSSLIFLIMM